MLFVPGCRPVERQLYVVVEPLNARFVGAQPVEPKTRTYHRRVGSERPAELLGGVGQDWVPTELFEQETKVHVLPKASKKRRSNVFPEARTSEILCKPTEAQNQQLTSISQAVYQRFYQRFISRTRSRTRSALCSRLPNNEQRLFVSVNSFHARHVQKKTHKPIFGLVKSKMRA